MDIIPTTFLTHASDILGDTEYGLSGGAIAKACTAYSIDFDVNIPYSSSVAGAPNKRTALLDNVRMFSASQQYRIIKELCEHTGLPNPIPDAANNLKIQLIARYGGQFGASSSETLNLPLIEDTKHWLVRYWGQTRIIPGLSSVYPLDGASFGTRLKPLFFP